MNNFTYRLNFAKTGKLRFLSHHDLMRVLERAIRRSGVPVEYSEGFNPHPRISYHTALAVGIESAGELVDVKVGVWRPPAEVQRAIADQLPYGLALTSCEPVLPGTGSRIDKNHYEVRFDSCVSSPGDSETPHNPSVAIMPSVQHDIDRLLAAGEAFVTRVNPKGQRRINIRPYIAELRLLDATRLLIVLNVTTEGTARPEEVLSLLGLPRMPHGIAWHIVKTKTTFQRPKNYNRQDGRRRHR
jgi:radical SAM-linked protein